MTRKVCGCLVRRHAQGLGIATSLVSCGRPVVERSRYGYCEFHQRLRERKEARAALQKGQS